MKAPSTTLQVPRTKHQAPSTKYHTPYNPMRNPDLGFCLTCCAATAQNADPPNYFDPARFEADIRAFEKADSTSAYPDSSIIFYGSSSIRMWHDSLASDMAPLPVIGRGFGGSTMIDALKYADRVRHPTQTTRRRSLRRRQRHRGIRRRAESRNGAVQGTGRRRCTPRLPETEIYFLTIKPSPSRWDHWPQMNEANQMIRAVCDADPLLHYVDVASVMLGEDGMPKKDIFREDMLHMNRKGYALWTEVIRKALGAE